MMTESQTYLRQAEALGKQLDRLQGQIDNMQSTADQLNMEHDALMTKHREAYKEERESRRNLWRETFPRLTAPNEAPRLRWQTWRNISDLINKHPKYRYETQAKEYRVWLLLMKLSRFAQEMMGVENSACWNPRNPNPYLP